MTLKVFPTLLLLTATVSFGAKRFVNNVASQTCPAQYPTIQAGVDATSPGDIVYVCNSGMPYNEQVTITQDITLIGQNGATILPAPMAANTTSLVSGDPIAAAVLVAGTSRAVITNLIIDGSQNGVSDCATDPVGVFYRNASGTVGYTVVRNFTPPGSLIGCQTGVGIFVQSGEAGAANITAYANSIRNFGKTGIVGNEVGTTLNASNNIVEGSGPTPAVAQNGIQIGFGATGNVANNVVNNVVYSLCADVDNCAFSSTGILVYAPGGPVAAAGNKVNTTQTAIYVQDAEGGVIQGNLISNTLVWDGIAIYQTVPSTESSSISQNSITNSGESGIWISGTNCSVTANVINEAPVGVLFASGTGNTQSTNKFYNTPVNVQNPTLTAGARKSPRIKTSPMR